MAAAELKLNVTLDLAFFRQQLQKLTNVAQSEFTPQLRIKFNRSIIDSELNALQKSIARRNWNVNLNVNTTSLDVAIKKAKELQQILSQSKGRTARAGALQGVLGKESGRVILKKDDVKNVYSAAIKSGVEGLSGNANQTRLSLERELKAAFGGASDKALKGLINGLLEGEGNLASAAKSLGKAVEQGLKDALEIRSPSKKTQRIGEQTADGFWLGLLNNIARGERSAAVAIRSAIANAFKQGLSGSGEISGSMVAFERQLAEGVRRALAGAIAQALRDGMKGSISPGIKGTMVGGAGGFATGGIAAGLGAAKTVGAAGLAQLSQGGAGAGMQRALGALGGDTSGIQSFLAQGQEQVMNAVVQGGVQGAIVGAVGVAAVAGAAGFTSGAAQSLLKQGVEAFMNSMLRTAYVTVRDLTTGTYLLGSAAVTGLKTGDTQRAVGEVARALLNAGAETARNEGRALARQAGTGLMTGGRAAAGGISGALNAGQGGREQALQSAYDALIAVLIKGAVDLQGLPDGTTIRALKQAVLSLKAAMEIASVQVGVAGEASRPGVRNMLRSGERANGARLSPIIGTTVEDLGNTKYLPRPGEGQSGRKIQEGLDNIAKAAAEAARQALNNQARAIANATRGVQVRDLGTTGQPLLSGGRAPNALPQGVGRAPAPYGQAYNPYAIAKYAGGGGGGGTGGGPGNFAAAGGGSGSPFGNGGFNVPKLPGAGLVREIGTEFGFAAKQVLLFGTAYKALAFIQGFPAQVGDAVGALQSFRNTIGEISPSAEEAAASSQFILDVVDKYNTPIQSARDGFTKLYASMKPTGFSGNEIRDLFLGISQAAATFGMSAEKVDRVNYAFAQMASKGQVMSEELKGQLGDVLPGAMGIFAEAAGFTGPDAITKFSKALEDGAYKGAAMKTLLTSVGAIMRKEFGPGAEGAARTFQGVINRMQNSFKFLYESFEPVAVGFLNSVVMPITSGIKTLTDGFNAFFTDTLAKTEGGAAFAQQLNNLKPSFEGIRANLAALIPSFQAFGQLLLSVTQFLVTLAGNPLAGFLLKVYTNILLVNTAFTLLGGKILLGLIANIGAAIARLVAFNATMNALAIASGRAGTSVAGTALQMQFLQARAASAAGPIAALLGSLLSMAAIGAIAIVVTIAVNGLTQLAEAQARIAKLRGEKDPVGPAGPKPIITAERRYIGATKEKIQSDQRVQQELVAGYRSQLAPLKATQTKGGTALGQTAVGSLSNVLGGFTQENTAAKITELQLKIKNAEEVLNLDLKRYPTQAERDRASVTTTSTVAGGGGAGGGGKDKGADDAKRLREEIARQAAAASDALFAEQQRLLILQQTNPTAAAITEYTSQELTIQRELNAKLAEAKSEKEKINLKDIASNQSASNLLDLQNKINQARQQALAPIDDLLKDQKQQLLVDADIEKLLREGMSPERAKQVAEVRKLVRVQLEVLDAQIKDFRAALGARESREGSTEAVKNLRKELQGLEDDRKRAEGKGAEGEAGVPQDKPKDYLGDALTSAEARLEELLNPAYQLAEAAKAIGDSFGEAFKGVITGSMTAREALAGFFQSVASSFTDMVAQMIAEWLKAQLIKGFLSIVGAIIPGFGAAAGAVGSGFDMGAGINGSGLATANLGNSFQYANGGIASGGFRAFASGGVVTGPTLGLVGEGRYNEAVIPLPDGKSVPVQLAGDGGGNAAPISTSIVVNVKNGQAESQMSGNQGNQLARELEGAVRQVILKESRPGGLISSSR